MEEHRLNRAQRVVVVIALGFALIFLGAWITSIGSHLPYGSVTYTNVGAPHMVGGFHPWVRTIIWMFLVAVWVSISILLLQGRSFNHRGRPPAA